MSDMLNLKDVKKQYIEPNGEILTILDIADFQVATGEQMVLLGRSGCGKTTLLYVIAGISRADTGKVMIDNLDIQRLSESGRDCYRAEKIGYVFQTFNLLPGFSALENVMLGMTFARQRKNAQHAKRLLTRVGLGHRMTHKPTAMSVGEQQRVAVARALANRPKLLLADEPTANVDPGNQKQIVELIRETCSEENVTLVMVTHAMEVASQFSRTVRLEEINRATAESQQGDLSSNDNTVTGVP